MKMGDKNISMKDLAKWLRLKNMIICPDCGSKIKPYKTHGIVGCPVCGAEWNSMTQLRTEMKAKLEKEHEKHDH